MERIRVLLADDHALFREGLASILSAQSDFEVVGEAGDGVEVLVQARKLKPDLILMDIRMPGASGLEATREIKQELPDVNIVILTESDSEAHLFEAIKNGAQGYLLKSLRSEQMLSLLRAAARGEAAITPAMASLMLDEFRRLQRYVPPLPSAEMVALTAREQQVLSLAAQQLTDREIAQALALSLSTVKTHMRNVLAKLHAGNRHEAVRHAQDQGLL
ncbi:MAG: DNA-binding response regulator [Chloroflexi bacterium]|nr:MAG: DNA-binding response regulator [Chloroflexota bacterium]